MSKRAESGSEVEAIEVELLLDGLYRQYGVDFRDYARNSLMRRLRHCVREEGLPTISSLLERVLHDETWKGRVIQALTVNVSAMFRDPEFFVTIREQVIPMIRTYPFVRVWHAGCGSGEEVYSLAILLKEEGIYERCRIYATDVNELALSEAQSGLLPLRTMRENAANYLRAGGRGSLADYYMTRGDLAVMDRSLRRNVVFARHDLASEASFNEFNAILCRNVIIYFNRSLQERVHRLLYASLGMFGFLGLGGRETLQFSPHEHCYQVTSAARRLYRKVR
jgi:chemotaxis protein methyltransferase CheR